MNELQCEWFDLPGFMGPSRIRGSLIIDLLQQRGYSIKTLAEQAVLDACAAIVKDNLIAIAARNGRRMARWARAELARRESEINETQD